MPAAIVLDEKNRSRKVPLSVEEARAIAVEFEREAPRIVVAAVAGFPVVDSIPFEIDEPSRD